MRKSLSLTAHLSWERAIFTNYVISNKGYILNLINNNQNFVTISPRYRNINAINSYFYSFELKLIELYFGFGSKHQIILYFLLYFWVFNCLFLFSFLFLFLFFFSFVFFFSLKLVVFNAMPCTRILMCFLMFFGTTMFKKGPKIQLKINLGPH